MTRRLRRAAAASLLVAVGLLGAALAPTSALATFHLMQIREVYPGSTASPEAEYVELQMWAGGQNLVAGHTLRSYDAGGAVTSVSPFPADVAQGANQSTLVLATAQAEAQFGIVADAPLTAPGKLSSAGGAVCWETIDCVAWGSFTGSLPSPAGSPAAPSGIPDLMALRRSITRGCATLLDPADDDDSSAGDFAAVFPAPRPNSAAPTERACTGAGAGPGAGSPSQPDASAPETMLRKKPAKRTADRTPSFRFVSDEPGAGFECRFDGRSFRACRSPFTARRLSVGAHRFQVRARAVGGQADRSPASYRFRVVAGPR